jgi:hypothetical protein
MAQHPKLEAVDLNSSYLTGVIYDDVSLTLEIEFHLLEGHPQFTPSDSGDGCYRKGFIRFTDIEDLRLNKAQVEAGKPGDLSVIESGTIETDYCYMMSGWGEIELTAQSIRVAFD